MNLGLRKILAFVIVCLTSLGILISLFFLFQVWRYRQPITDKLQSNVDQFSSVIQITDDGLAVIDQVVKNVYTSTVYLDDATNAFSQTVHSTSMFMDSAGTFVGPLSVFWLITPIPVQMRALAGAGRGAGPQTR